MRILRRACPPIGRQIATTITVEETAPMARSINCSRNCTVGSRADKSRPKVEKGLERDSSSAAVIPAAASDTESAIVLNLRFNCSLDVRRTPAWAAGTEGGAEARDAPALDILASLDVAAAAVAFRP